MFAALAAGCRPHGSRQAYVYLRTLADLAPDLDLAAVCGHDAALGPAPCPRRPSCPCMALAFERSRSVYAAMLVHAAYNGSVATLMLLQ